MTTQVGKVKEDVYIPSPEETLEDGFHNIGIYNVKVVGRNRPANRLYSVTFNCMTEDEVIAATSIIANIPELIEEIA